MSERWYLARRLTRMFLATTLAFVVAISVASGLFLWRGVAKQVDALTHEELEETSARFETRPFDLALFRETIAEEQARHPGNHMAWRVWTNGPSSVPMDFGFVEMLAEHPPNPYVEGEIRYAGFSGRVSTDHLPDGTLVGLVLDGGPQYRQLGAYGLVVVILVAVTFGIVVLVSRRYLARVSRILHTVAERVRASQVRGQDEHIHVEGSPEEIREVADALSATLTKIRAESEDARVFTAGIAHELRSPVQNLIGETEVALISAREPLVYREVLNSHLEELRRLGDAVDNLVTICSRNETRRTAEREDFDLASEAELRLRRERSLAERHQLDFVLEARGNTQLRGDREAILRAVRNLAQNAIQWSPPRGRVEVKIEGGPEQVVVQVDDQGPGVPEDLRERIFEPFFRGPASQGRRLGYGLGLALAKSAVAEHGGHVEVESSPSGGARFRLVLPRSSPHRAA